MNITSPGTVATATHADMANAIRALAMDAVQKAKSGHPGMPMGMADVATVLFTRFLKFDAGDPTWPDRDRFVLSAGHGSMLIYSLLHLLGVDGVSMDELKNFRQLGSKTAGHPEFGHCPGVETTTGPLGQGITTAVGMALAERMLNARYGDDLVDHFTYVIAGDGCLMEGISHEAIDMAGHLGLSRLIVLWDDNAISIDGSTDLATSTDQLARFAAAGWDVTRVDGHDPEAIAAAIAAARDTDRPSLIACKTIIGFGAPNKQGTAATHGAPLGEDEIAAARESLGWPHAPFQIPAPVLAAWRAAGATAATARKAWNERLSASPQRDAFNADINRAIAPGFDAAVAAFKKAMAEEAPTLATRVASQKVLDEIAPVQTNMIGGSADLTGSNNTRAKCQDPITPGDFSGRYIHYGVREHAMAAVMNGIALHGGLIPYGGTFLVFADYCRPAIRLSALMGKPVIYVMTHDSIGLGEDGPTHQPVEHLASLRAMPNVNVYRPADVIETAECWQLALKSETTPSILCLSRQGLPSVRAHAAGEDNLSARGGYVLKDTGDTRDVTVIATGSEVATALQAADALAGEGIAAAVVSMPCMDLFERQDEAYRRQVLGSAPRLAVEAAVRTGWDRWIGEDGEFIGMTGFGASAPAADLFAHFAITADNVAAAARRLAGKGK